MLSAMERRRYLPFLLIGCKHTKAISNVSKCPIKLLLPLRGRKSVLGVYGRMSRKMNVAMGKIENKKTVYESRTQSADEGIRASKT